MVTQLKKPDAAALPVTDGAQVENLADLTREAKAVDQGDQAGATGTNHAQQQADAGQSQQAQAEAREFVKMLVFVRDLAADVAHEAGWLTRDKTLAIWTDARMAGLVPPLCAIAERHGAALTNFFERHGPYIMLVTAAAMPTIATIKAIREQQAVNAQARVTPVGEGAARE